jgi:hypothetical protein
MSGFQYTPRTVGMIKLHAKTMAPPTIATIMRCSVGTVELICRKHGIDILGQDKEAPAPKTAFERAQDRKYRGTHVRIYIDDISLVAVSNEARRRGCIASDLIAQIVEMIADDRMFSAVLDR